MLPTFPTHQNPTNVYLACACALPCLAVRKIGNGNLHVLLRQSIDVILIPLFFSFSARDQDLAFTRMFAIVKPRAIPIPTYLLFTVRDGITVAASFNMPSPVSEYLQERFGMSEQRADITAQVCTATASRSI